MNEPEFMWKPLSTTVTRVHVGSTHDMSHAGVRQPWEKRTPKGAPFSDPKKLPR